MSAWETADERSARERIEARWRAAMSLVRRSVLIVPANVPRFVESAHRRGADAIILDLEDSIPPSEKQSARQALSSAVPMAGRAGADVIVRVNKPYELARRDVVAAVSSGAGTICFPKAETAREISILDALIGEQEEAAGARPGSVAIAVTIETARGLAAIDEVLSASDRIVTVDVGAEDFTRDLGIAPTESGHELLYARQRVVQAARCAGVQALGLATTLANYTDLAALERSATTAREMGFWGAPCIHPAQVPVLNAAFAPPAVVVDWARRALDAYESAVAAGRASAAVDGRMVDVPVAERARAMLDRAAAIAGRLTTSSAE